jgi:glutathione synthase/RimK-type ligase-like ATP-grasp enzyme
MIITVLSRPGSVSAANLTAALVARGINASRATSASVRRTRQDRVIINLGVSTAPARFEQRSVTYSNMPHAVVNCADKIRTLELLARADVPAIEWISENHIPPVGGAMQWLESDGKLVVRHTVTGHSGQGIQIVRRGEAIPDAPLYTRYFRKDAEYRVHVAFGNVILIQQKRKENGREQSDIERLVRTHAHGWKFCSADLACDDRGYRDALCDLALRGATAVGANHCAVDVLVRHSDPCDLRIVEINSHPALRADSTLNAYTNAFEHWLRQHNAA